MRLLVLLAIVFISVSLMAQTLPSVCRIDQIADYTIQEGPGHSFSVYGTMYLCNYSGNLLNNIQKYTGIIIDHLEIAIDNISQRKKETKKKEKK